MPTNLDYSSVNDLYKLLKGNFDGHLSTDQLQDGLKAGLVNAAGDPFTEYMTAKQAKSFNDELDGAFTGIGAELGQDSNKNIQVIAPLAGFPAQKAGLMPKDIIAAIDGKSTAGMTVSQAVDLIRGPAGTKVTLQIVRGGQQALELTITRQNITVPSVTSKVVNSIGYLTISRFGDDTASFAQQAADSFVQQHVKGVVVDLRSDPGGLLDAAVSVSSLWLPSGKTILTERHGGVTTQTYTASGSPTLQGMPTVVLIDSGSASAAEITAAALRDNGAAKLVGQTSYGKGSVQQVIKLGGGAILKVTVAHWYTPGGKNINKAGIKPDQTVVYKASPQGADGTDSQMAAALAILNK